MRRRHIDPLIRAAQERDPACRFDNEIGTVEFRNLPRSPVWNNRHGMWMTVRQNWLRVAAVALLAVVSVGVITYDQPTATDAAPADISTDETRLVQWCLRGFGYGLAVDSIYGPQTTKAVMHFQSVSGLVVDGIAGPKTMAALDRAGCSFTAPYVAPPAPSTGGGGGGAGGRCPQWHPLLAANGLPVAFFDMVIYRESRCDPNAYNGQCSDPARNVCDDSYSLTQINAYGAQWGELQWRCGLTAKSQLFDPATNIRCAGILYRAYGTRPWA